MSSPNRYDGFCYACKKVVGAYAGVPLEVSPGLVVGALCVIDHERHAFSTADLELLGTDASGEITKAPQPSFYRFFKSRKESFLKLSNNPDLSDRRCAGPKKTQEIRFLLRSGDASNATAIQVSDTKVGETTVVFVLRSPEAMLFYLGELARAQLDGFYDQTGVPQIPGPMDAITVSYGLSRDPQSSIGKQVKLFALSKGTLPKAVGISVEVEGQTYNVPAGSLTDRSMHVISLVSQVLMLQNKGAELPTTSSVRIVP